MKTNETRIKSANGKNLYRVSRVWYDVDQCEYQYEATYSIRFDGMMGPAWTNLELAAAQGIMSIATKSCLVVNSDGRMVPEMEDVYIWKR